MLNTPPQEQFSICLLEDKNKRLLFLKRSPNDTFGAGKWGFPAGHIESDETAFECALRELDEEIGQDHQLVALNSIGPVRDTFYGGKFDINLFHFAWSSGHVELNEEHTEHAWVTRRHFSNMDVMLGIEQDIVLLDIWPADTFKGARLGTLPHE